MDEKETEKELFRSENEATNALREVLRFQRMAANRNLQVLNGSGAVALLAFLGQTWPTVPELRMALAIGTAFMVIGLCLAVWGSFQLPTYFELEFRENEGSSQKEKYAKTRCSYVWTSRCSIAAFCLAVAIILGKVVSSIF